MAIKCFPFTGTHPLKFLNKSRLPIPHRFQNLKTAASEDPNSQQQQLDLTVLRFTFGIPGFDESYLPRFIGAAFGSLIIANHLLSSSSPTPAQLVNIYKYDACLTLSPVLIDGIHFVFVLVQRSEALGICLAVFSTTLPYLGKFLKGASPVDRASLPEGNKQIFLLTEDLSSIEKENLAWVSYVLLRNTNTMSVVIVVGDALCVRGYWNTPENFSKAQTFEWFKSQIELVAFKDLTDMLYFPQSPDTELQGMLPKGVLSLLVQPLCEASVSSTDARKNIGSFILLASSAKYAYSEKDRAWIRAIANKFQGMNSVYNVKA